MFGLEFAAAQLAYAKEVQKRRNERLEALDPESRAIFLKLEEEARKEATIERRHRELCASIENAGKNACFW